ncbi:Similar to 1-Aminocyclopropane-1-Carboxylate Deaminase [Ectocarpus siliculosus]|uniref:Similar to 1-Aminocyclopropane-1-Carboxylate Deaminase n=1 Tax=Ectocarpus siliculosus TaxID=2880 RepID=D7G221_ECTSI|nr:Similar to 1-Aminocyclopropane-1-Carboxylate Deaminase [Ectocarpus siliculosus]|eukprot:CBJ33324.1 Similar to 1-Aminocyclopropane-1-Carboxylate Deaminase [Ectocarpus siliculosus]
MMCVQLSRPSLLSLVAAGLLTPSRGIAVGNCGDHRHHHHHHERRHRRRRLAPGGGSWSGGTHGLRLLSSPSSGAHEGETGRRSSGSNEQQERHQGGGRSGDGGTRRTHDTGRPSSSLPARQREARTRRHRGRQGGGWGGDGDRQEDWGGDSGRSLVEEEREAQEVQGAVALAAAKRGPGERGRLVASESPVEEFVIRGRRVLVKRDDKMRLAESGLSGNKARKLYALNKTPASSFPESNAMVAIAAVVASKPGSSFIYYTKPVPKWLRRNPVGNFARTIALGAEIMEVHTEDYKRIFGGADGPGASYSDVVPEEALFLPQGGADAAAEE